MKRRVLVLHNKISYRITLRYQRQKNLMLTEVVEGKRRYDLVIQESYQKEDRDRGHIHS
jgi:hypothetical protein